MFNQPTKEKKVKKAKKATEPEPAVEEDAEDEAEVVDVDGDEVLNDADLSEADSNESLDLPSDSDDDDGVEEAYAASRVANRLKAMAAGAKEDDEEEEGDDLEVDDEDDESELDIENLMHESVMPKLRKIKSAEGGNMVPIPAAKLKKAKAISTDTPEERDARTVFLGNVPVACSTSTVRLECCSSSGFPLTMIFATADEESADSTRPHLPDTPRSSSRQHAAAQVILHPIPIPRFRLDRLWSKSDCRRSSRRGGRRTRRTRTQESEKLERDGG